MWVCVESRGRVVGYLSGVLIFYSVVFFVNFKVELLNTKKWFFFGIYLFVSKFYWFFCVFLFILFWVLGIKSWFCF